jgi:hypothetical protein
VAGNSLFIGDTEGRLYQLRRRDGSLVWHRQGLGRLTPPPPWQANSYTLAYAMDGSWPSRPPMGIPAGVWQPEIRFFLRLWCMPASST